MLLRPSRAANEIRLHRVIGYLAEYKDLELHCKVTDLQLHAYFDAEWVCHSDMKGHSGMVLTLRLSNLVQEPEAESGHFIY